MVGLWRVTIDSLSDGTTITPKPFTVVLNQSGSGMGASYQTIMTHSTGGAFAFFDGSSPYAAVAARGDTLQLSAGWVDPCALVMTGVVRGSRMSGTVVFSGSDCTTAGFVGTGTWTATLVH